MVLMVDKDHAFVGWTLELSMEPVVFFTKFFSVSANQPLSLTLVWWIVIFDIWKQMSNSGSSVWQKPTNSHGSLAPPPCVGQPNWHPILQPASVAKSANKVALGRSLWHEQLAVLPSLTFTFSAGSVEKGSRIFAQNPLLRTNFLTLRAKFSRGAARTLLIDPFSWSTAQPMLQGGCQWESASH